MPRLFVATVGAGLHRSDDLGARWVREPGVPADARLYSLGVTAGDLLVGGAGVVYRRTERAWSELALPAGAREVWAVAAVEGAILAGTRPLGLLRSDDGGCTWARVALASPVGTAGPPAPRVTSLLPNPAVAGEVWAAVEGAGVFASGDGGRSWSPASDGLASPDVHALAWSSGGILLAAAPGGVVMWRSARWIQATFEPADRYCRALAARPDDPGVLYCGFGDGPPGSRGGVAVSRDGGRLWRACPGMPDLAATVWSVAAAEDAPGLVVAASHAGRVAVGRDDGARWATVLEAGVETPAVACLPE